MIDFRSDTVTQPTPEMMEAMMNAPVGDDVFGEDPTVNLLQQKVADFFGYEAGLFCASGTQTNQIAINVHVQPGGEVITHQESHIYKYEGGGIAKNSGASVRLLGGDRGRITANEISEWINPDDVHLPVTQLVSLEDTSNRGGGAIYDFTEIEKISQFCKKNHLPLHLDGARVMNALIENQIDPKRYGQQFDSISICLSKGLGAPVGSVLIGNNHFIHKARRVRKVMGGGMRQAGIIAGGALYAFENQYQRLKEDHRNAKQLEIVLNEQSWVESVMEVQTNIVVFHLETTQTKEKILNYLKKNGILAVSFGVNMVRLVTHLDISPEDIAKTCEVIRNFKV